MVNVKRDKAAASLVNTMYYWYYYNSKGGIMAIKQELLDILACPKCKGDIRLNDSKDGLICDSCKLLYHIKDDIPIMLIEEAESIKE